MLITAADANSVTSSMSLPLAPDQPDCHAYVPASANAARAHRVASLLHANLQLYGPQRDWATGRKSARNMKLVVSIVVLVVIFVVGLGVGAWKPHVITEVMIRLGLQDRGFESQGPYYRSKLASFEQAAGDADVIMLGDSITEKIDWRELFPGVSILNRGIGGDTSAGVLKRLDEVIARHPKIVFLMVGVNDLQI